MVDENWAECVIARPDPLDLAACGFPLCKGNIMGSNPELCLTLEQWKRRFVNWINEPDPQALLNASIFFDFRPLYGNERLSDQLHTHLGDGGIRVSRVWFWRSGSAFGSEGRTARSHVDPHVELLEHRFWRGRQLGHTLAKPHEFYEVAILKARHRHEPTGVVFQVIEFWFDLPDGGLRIASGPR